MIGCPDCGLSLFASQSDARLKSVHPKNEMNSSQSFNRNADVVTRSEEDVDYFRSLAV